jgi:hypothetical protein
VGTQVCTVVVSASSKDSDRGGYFNVTVVKTDPKTRHGVVTLVVTQHQGTVRAKRFFQCVKCGHLAHADTFAARHILQAGELKTLKTRGAVAQIVNGRASHGLNPVPRQPRKQPKALLEESRPFRTGRISKLCSLVDCTLKMSGPSVSNGRIRSCHRQRSCCSFRGFPFEDCHIGRPTSWSRFSWTASARSLPQQAASMAILLSTMALTYFFATRLTVPLTNQHETRVVT